MLVRLGVPTYIAWRKTSTLLIISKVDGRKDLVSSAQDSSYLVLRHSSGMSLEELLNEQVRNLNELQSFSIPLYSCNSTGFSSIDEPEAVNPNLVPLARWHLNPLF